MSAAQPSTAAYRAAMRRSGCSPVLLVKITITAPAAATYYLGATEVITPDGVTWEAGLQAEPITDGVEFMGPGPNLVGWTFAFANRTISSQGASGYRFDGLLKANQFKGARVQAYLWETSLANFSDALQVFDGRIGTTRPTPEKVEFMCAQSVSWDATVPPKIIDKTNSPNAPDASMGMPYAIIAGAWTKPTLPGPFTATDDKENDQSGGGRLAVPYILADPGLGAANVKAIASGHLMKKLLNIADGHGVFTRGHDGRLSLCDNTGISESLNASESYLSINDGQLIAYAGVLATAVCTNAAAVNNSASNPRNAMSPFEPSDFASIDQTTGKNALVLYLPDLTSLGTILSVTGIAKVSLPVINTQAIRIYPTNVDTGAASAGPITLAAGQPANTLLTLSGAWDGNYWNHAWQFGMGGVAGSLAGVGPHGFVVDFAGAVANNKASIFWVALIVEYRPNRTMVAGAQMGIRVMPGPGHGVKGPMNILYDESGVKDVWFGKTNDRNHQGAKARPYSPAVYELDVPFFGNVEGFPDTAGGLYTGVGNRLLEIPCDIARWLLVAFGGLDATADFELAAGEHGSFTDCRYGFADDWPEAFRSQLYVGQQQKLSDVLKTLCSQTLATMWLDRFTSKWRMGVWRSGAIPDYDHTFTWDTIDFVSAECLADSDSVQEVRLRYGLDLYSQRQLWETYVSPAGSSGGQILPTYRDQGAITIGGTNDKIDFVHKGITRAAGIAHATYSTVMDLAYAVTAAMNAVAGADEICAGFGFSIKAGFNAALTITYPTATANHYTATMAEGDYSSDGLALEVQRALNALGLPTTFGCTYDHSTNLFTITSTNAFDLWDVSGATKILPGWMSLGFDGNFSGTSITGSIPIYWDHYWIAARDYGAHAGVNLLWGTGVNAANNADQELGYAALDTGSFSIVYADYGRGMREIAAAAMLAQNGPRDPDQFTVDCIGDERSAVRVRNRRFDLRTRDRVIVTFRTTMAPDLQRLRAIRFDSTLDAHVLFPRYGSDGSWANKAFRVLSVTQYVDAQYHQEITAIEI